MTCQPVGQVLTGSIVDEFASWPRRVEVPPILRASDPGLTPGFVHRGNSRPMSEFYQVPADPSAPWTACPFAVVVSKLEFVFVVACECHGERVIGHAD